MEQQELQTPPQAALRFQKTLEGYKSSLQSNPSLKLSEYCKDVHTQYKPMLHWMERQGHSVRDIKREISGQSSANDLMSSTSPTFVQFVPNRRQSSEILAGVSITFPDGVNLTLQEACVESVISLLSIYQSRHGGTPQCSD